MSSVRPWNAWSNAITAGRPVAARGDLHRVLDRFRARVHEQRPLLVRARRALRELLAHRDVALVGRDLEARVHEVARPARRSPSTTFGCACPTFTTAMPAPRSMRRLPSTSSTIGALRIGHEDGQRRADRRQGWRVRGAPRVLSNAGPGISVMSSTLLFHRSSVAGQPTRPRPTAAQARLGGGPPPSTRRCYCRSSPYEPRGFALSLHEDLAASPDVATAFADALAQQLGNDTAFTVGPPTTSLAMRCPTMRNTRSHSPSRSAITTRSTTKAWQPTAAVKARSCSFLRTRSSSGSNAPPTSLCSRPQHRRSTRPSPRWARWPLCRPKPTRPSKPISKPSRTSTAMSSSTRSSKTSSPSAG